MTHFEMTHYFLATLDAREREFTAKTEVDERIHAWEAVWYHNTALLEDERRTDMGIPPAFEDAYYRGYYDSLKSFPARPY